MGEHAYFQQVALVSYRFFHNEDEPELILILEWNSRGEMQATTDTGQRRSTWSPSARATVLPIPTAASAGSTVA
jgi:hypothetical protein